MTILVDPNPPPERFSRFFSGVLLTLGTGQAIKTDEFSGNFQRGGVFNPKNYVADFGPLKMFFFAHSLKKIAI